MNTSDFSYNFKHDILSFMPKTKKSINYILSNEYDFLATIKIEAKGITNDTDFLYFSIFQTDKENQYNIKLLYRHWNNDIALYVLKNLEKIHKQMFGFKAGDLVSTDNGYKLDIIFANDKNNPFYCEVKLRFNNILSLTKGYRKVFFSIETILNNEALPFVEKIKKFKKLLHIQNI